jgi:hypothetical protein
MSRNMSFAITTDQMRRRSKTVTRRMGWWFLKPGDIVNAVEKARGLKKGKRVRRICRIRIMSTRPEILSRITQGDCAREGFPEMTPSEFVEMFCCANRCRPDNQVNRIEFDFL